MALPFFIYTACKQKKKPYIFKKAVHFQKSRTFSKKPYIFKKAVHFQKSRTFSKNPYFFKKAVLFKKVDLHSKKGLIISLIDPGGRPRTYLTPRDWLKYT